MVAELEREAAITSTRVVYIALGRPWFDSSKPLLKSLEGRRVADAEAAMWEVSGNMPEFHKRYCFMHDGVLVDAHPNAEAHRLAAHTLVEALTGGS